MRLIVFILMAGVAFWFLFPSDARQAAKLNAVSDDVVRITFPDGTEVKSQGQGLGRGLEIGEFPGARVILADGSVFDVGAIYAMREWHGGKWLDAHGMVTKSHLERYHQDPEIDDVRKVRGPRSALHPAMIYHRFMALIGAGG